MPSSLLDHRTVSIRKLRIQSPTQYTEYFSQHLCLICSSAQPKASLAAMQLTSTIVALSSLLCFSLAAPQAAPSTTTATASSSIPTTGEYYLKSQVINRRSASKNGLYVSAYHTGAGLNDATLGPGSEGSAKGFLNETYQQFDLGTAFPWGLSIGADTNYAGMISRSARHTAIPTPVW